MGDPEEVPVQPGDVLAGKYRVERILGIGGMGAVVAAIHMELDQRVALKFLLPSVADKPEVVSRFAREARAAAKIRSEHVARVTDVGTLESGTPYIVMEYLEGRDLDAIVTDDGPLPIPSPWTTCCRPASRSPRPTRRASSTAISSPRTSSSRGRPTAA